MPSRRSVVVIGGGTGTHTVLKGLKRYADTLSLSAIVTMADSGGSTGRLRDEFGYLPVGDVRMALAALAREDDAHDELVRALFLHRFTKGAGLDGHNVGNLLLVALTDMLGSEEEAIHAASRVLNVCGEVVPVTTEQAELVATYDDGVVVEGEHIIDEPQRGRHAARITQLALVPEAAASARALAAIQHADLIVLGPGDLYTSILANCVVRGIPEALAASPARIAYVANLMTRRGQTHGMGVAAHVAEIERYIQRPVDRAIVNTAPLPAELMERYAAAQEFPVVLDMDMHDERVVRGDIISPSVVPAQAGDILKRSLVRHDPDALARILLSL